MSTSSATVIAPQFAAEALPCSPTVKDFIDCQFYVDDGLSCADTDAHAIATLDQTIKKLSSYNIRLHKICSSSPTVIEAFPDTERAANPSKELKENPNQTALGLIWDTSADSIVLRTDVPDRPFTRRGKSCLYSKCLTKTVPFVHHTALGWAPRRYL